MQIYSNHLPVTSQLMSPFQQAPQSFSMAIPNNQLQLPGNPDVALFRLLEGVIGRVLDFAFGLVSQLSGANGVTGIPAGTGIPANAQAQQNTPGFWIDSLITAGSGLWDTITSLLDGGGAAAKAGQAAGLFKSLPKVGGLVASLF